MNSSFNDHLLYDYQDINTFLDQFENFNSDTYRLLSEVSLDLGLTCWPESNNMQAHVDRCQSRLSDMMITKDITDILPEFLTLWTVEQKQKLVNSRDLLSHQHKDLHRVLRICQKELDKL